MRGPWIRVSSLGEKWRETEFHRGDGHIDGDRLEEDSYGMGSKAGFPGVHGEAQPCDSCRSYFQPRTEVINCCCDTTNFVAFCDSHSVAETMGSF